MTNDNRRKARAGTTPQPVAKEVVACLAAHTGLPQADFRTKRKIKRFAAGGKRRGALIRALLARPALKQLGLRQQHFDKAELSGKSTVGDIIGIITVVAKTAKPPEKAKKRTPATGGAKRRPAKTSKAAKPAKKTKQVAAGKATKPVVRTSKAPKSAAKKTALRRTEAAPKAKAASLGPIGRRPTKATTASKPRLEEDAGATPPAEAPRAERARRAPRALKASHAEALDSSSVPGPEEMALEANVRPDSSAAEPQASRVADVLRCA
jgi:hypothetical protein